MVVGALDQLSLTLGPGDRLALLDYGAGKSAAPARDGQTLCVPKLRADG